VRFLHAGSLQTSHGDLISQSSSPYIGLHKEKLREAKSRKMVSKMLEETCKLPMKR